MCSDTTWSIPWCAAVSVSISVVGHLSAVGGPLRELGDDGTEGVAEKSGAACTKGDHTVKVLQADNRQYTHKQTNRHNINKSIQTWHC